MESPRFMVLTGHLNDYPLSDLIGILHHQRKTGRLLIEYPQHPGVFYFKDGHVVEAQFDSLSGLQAVCVALSQPNATFNFNPLIQPPRQSLDSWSQKVILELFGCWSEEPLPITIAQSPQDIPALPAPPVTLPIVIEQPPHTLSPDEQPALSLAAGEQPKPTKAPIILIPPAPLMPRGAAQHSKGRVLLASGAACLLLLCLSVVVSLTHRTGQTQTLTPIADRLLPATPTEETSPNVSVRQTDDASVPASSPAASALAPASEGRATANKFRKFKRESERGNIQSSAAHAEQDETETPATKPPTASAAKPAAVGAAVGKKPAAGGADGEAVRVLMQIENGRVVRASVVNSRPGMEAYEAHALRLARGRRYATKTGQETMSIKVNPSQP